MPDILVLVSQRDAERLAPHFDKIASLLRETVEILSSKNERLTGVDAEAYLIPWVAASNAARVQILAIASWSETREEKLDEWQLGLARAWKFAITSCYPTNKDLWALAHEIDGKVEAWPLMPKGKWGMVPLVFGK